jgi:riboflavin kinase/FMN adenylyltransferase
VTIGAFDGVHRGHRTIIGRAVREAESRGVRSVAVTFDPHPMSVVRPESVPPMLQVLEDRVASLAEAGVDLVLVLPFTAELSQLDPASFVERVLAGRLGAVKVIVGTNFRFGHRAAGDVGTLTDLGNVHGFETEAVALLQLDEHPISSTEVRRHIEAGDVAWAAAALGRPWRYVGEVVRGDGRGRTIGVPTANVVADDDLLRPGDGVYAARVRRGADAWDAVVNVGTRPTFDGTTTTVEAHLLDASERAEDLDLYGQVLAVELLDRLRGEQKFDGPDALVAQIHRDIEAARSMFSTPS